MATGTKNIIRKITKHPKFITFFGYVLYYYSRVIGLTTRWEVHGMEELYKNWDKDSLILIAWHGRTLMIPHFYNRKKPINALVSLHNDGRIMAKILEKYGFGTIGGSSSQGGKTAALGLMSSLEKKQSIAIIPDGPIGPRMKMTNSPFYFAKKTGKPILGITYSIQNSIIVKKSWDAMMLPLPFCKGIVYVTKPYYIPADAGKADIEQYRQELEDELNTLTFKADKQLGIPQIEVGVTKKSKYQTKKETTKDVH